MFLNVKVDIQNSGLLALYSEVFGVASFLLYLVGFPVSFIKPVTQRIFYFMGFFAGVVW